MGNILYKETFMDELDDNKAQYLIEKWTSKITDSLRQTVTSYYSNGQLKYKENYTVIDQKYLNRDCNKAKRLTYSEAYLENGQKCLIEELTYDQWYQPGTRMKK